MFHTHFGVRDELLHFEKDLAIAGGLLVLALHGVGDWSIESTLPRSLAARLGYWRRLNTGVKTDRVIGQDAS